MALETHQYVINFTLAIRPLDAIRRNSHAYRSELSIHTIQYIQIVQAHETNPPIAI